MSNESPADQARNGKYEIFGVIRIPAIQSNTYIDKVQFMFFLSKTSGIMYCQFLILFIIFQFLDSCRKLVEKTAFQKKIVVK